MKNDSIVKTIELKASPARVWRALTDAKEFGEWFRVKLENPFEVGKETTGRITYPGYEHLRWNATVVKMEKESLFAFTWHPYAIDPKKNYEQETPTLVEFRLAAIPGGTLLTLTESGFSKIPPERRDEAFRMNEGGWAEQMKNIATHVGGN